MSHYTLHNIYNVKLRTRECWANKHYSVGAKDESGKFLHASGERISNTDVSFQEVYWGRKGHSDQAPSGDWPLNSIASAVFLSTSQISFKQMSQGRETNKP